MRRFDSDPRLQFFSCRSLSRQYLTRKCEFGVIGARTPKIGQIHAAFGDFYEPRLVRDVTLRHDLHALSKFFGYAIKRGWARENPIRKVDIPSDTDAVHIYVIDPAEEKAYFTPVSAHQDLHDLGRLMLNQGAPPDEILRLAKANVNLERGQAYTTNGKSKAPRRALDLTTESRQILAQRMKGESPWVFPWPRHRGFHVSRLNSAHDRDCAAKSGQLKDLTLLLHLRVFRPSLFQDRNVRIGVLP
jgi:integrase